MRREIVTIRNGAVAVVGALGFGATQALATPDDALRTAPAACKPAACDRSCRAMGADGGDCFDGQCLCFSISH
ncbi:MAG TPA: hypothetical protein VFQ76_17800 [Longimicrobiaceae bacterium]|nr:hypothetical protein [Longimicrobiaceae bacterium]